uniref:Uncharacterized protein n=1 Tax=Stegastes partitus TaxID=144197 RepID=A0A3B4ZFP6_9TELE
ITREASFRARDAFISPSAAITYRSREKNVSTVFTSLISTRSTLMPQWSVASSRLLWKRQEKEELTSVALGVIYLYIYIYMSL